MSSSQRPEIPLVSVVVPVLNEEGCIEEFVRRTRASAEEAGVRYEIIFVDDGSTDATPLRIDEQHEADAAVKTVRFTRSFGHQAALSAGLEYASGDAVITMDGDLQHPPEAMSDLVKSWRAGADVVYTERRLPARYQNTLKARFSRLFYQAQTRLTNLPPAASNADFRLMDRRAVENYNRLTEHFVFVRGLVPWLGFAADRIEYEVEDRFAGDPKFTPRQMVRLALDGIFSFTVIPLRLITLLGLFTTFLGVCYATFALASFAFGYTDKTGWTSLVVLMLLFGGVQLMSLGIVSEYIGRIYEEVKGRPRYVIDSLSGFERR